MTHVNEIAEEQMTPMSTAADPLRPKQRLAMRALTLGVSYYLAAHLGLLIPYVGSHVSLFWLSTGIAMAGYRRWGTGMCPAVAIAAFAVNFQIGGPVWMALDIAVGNALGPLLGAALLRWWAFDSAPTRRRDLGVFLFADMDARHGHQRHRVAMGCGPPFDFDLACSLDDLVDR